MDPSCRLCGDEKPLTPDGVCEWTAGCEHRVMQAQADQARFDADYRHHFVPFDCGHTGAEHIAQWAEIHDAEMTAENARIRDKIARFMDEDGTSWDAWPDLYDGYGDWPET